MWMLPRRTDFPILRVIQKHILRINASFSIALLIACILRSRRSISEMEMEFLVTLTVDQMLICLYILVATNADQKLYESTIGRRWNVSYAVLALAHMVASIISNIPNRQDFHELAMQCQQQHQYPSLEHHLVRYPSDGSKYMSCSLLLAFAICSLYPITTVVCGCGVPRSAPQWLKVNVDHLYAVFCMFTFVGSVILNVMSMKGVREQVVQFSVAQKKGQGWGYVQTTAVLIWVVPLLVGLGKAIGK